VEAEAERPVQLAGRLGDAVDDRLPQALLVEAPEREVAHEVLHRRTRTLEPMLRESRAQLRVVLEREGGGRVRLREDLVVLAQAPGDVADVPRSPRPEQTALLEREVLQGAQVAVPAPTA
jgi:hypothetical protein